MDDENFFDLIRRISHKCREREDRVKRKFALSPAEYEALISLQGRERVTCREFSSRMRLSVSRGSRIIDKLYSRGLIQRTDLDTDRRCKNIWLTDKGKKVRDAIRQKMSACENQLTSVFSAAELRSLKQSLRRVLAAPILP
jgi:DNA-binding MarR family transcriptional regulator